MGVEVSGEITRGEASDLLSLESTRPDLEPLTNRPAVGVATATDGPVGGPTAAGDAPAR
jgi:hypothetical protein